MTPTELKESERKAKLARAHRSLALLFVVRWARYRRSQLVERQPDGREFERLASKLPVRNPIPPDHEDPDYCRLLLASLGNVEGLDPSPQEAYLSVELAIRLWRFEREQALAGWANQPWSFFANMSHQRESKQECLGLLVFLSETLSRFKARTEDL